MVFLIVMIVTNLGILKDWFGCQYSDMKNLLDLYNNFSFWSMDIK